MFAKEIARELTNGKLLSSSNEQLLRNYLHKRFIDYKAMGAFISFSHLDTIRSSDSVMCLPITLFEDVKAWLESNGFRVISDRGNVNSASINVYLDL